ncbi:MAG: hypothetical protein ACYDCO_00785 [Armatimonadota bacterium]
MSTDQEQSTGAGKPARVECVECGSPYIGERQAARLQEKLGLADETVQRCPRCRRRQLLREFEARCIAERTGTAG